MNGSMIRYVLSHIVRIEGLLLFLPCLVALIYREQQGVIYAGLGLICILLGSFLGMRRPRNNTFYLKEGCITTALSWLVLSAIGALPFVITGEIPDYTNALFETISGFTTTGSSILSDVEALSHTSLFWRSFTHWVGGMGILVFMLAIIPMVGGSPINLMRAESPGPEVDKTMPKMRQSAGLLYIIYAVLTLAQIILLVLSRMPVFDAICLSLGTAGTGGFGILNSSVGSYHVLSQWIITIFMILFGINFNFYYFLADKKARKALAMEEVRVYLGIVLLAVLVVTVNILPMTAGFFDALTKSAFQVGSIITTTGYSTTDFDLWPKLSQAILVLLMFIGACAGSTGGGIKVSRIWILFKSIKKEMHLYLHPRNVEKVYMDRHPVEHDTMRSVNIYLAVYIVIFLASLLGICAIENTDLVTAFTSVAATFNNIGPGLSLVGPTANFGWMQPVSKYILMFDMLAGRLEIWPMLLLFYPRLWRNAIELRNSYRRMEDGR